MELTIFILITSVILMTFIIGIILFVWQYRKKRMQHEQEKVRLSEQHSKAILSAQLGIQTQTMHDIGREIHDHVGQKLTLAALYAHTSITDTSETLSAKLLSVGQLINESLEDLRLLSRSLVSSDADSEELTAALTRAVKSIQGLGRVKIEYSIHGNPFGTSTTVKNFLTRIAQESLQNCLKHAECGAIHVELFYEEGRLRLVVSDDGKGFQINRQHAGIGLKNIRERVQLIGAHLEINSIPNRGTTITVTLNQENLY